MYKKDFILALRTLTKNFSYTLINLGGLTIGITTCLLILSFVKYELSFDQFHHNKDQLYRVNYDVFMGGSQTVSPSVPIFVGLELKRRFPEIEDVNRSSFEWRPRTIRHKEVFFDETGFMYADPNFFKTFDFKAHLGDLNTALSRPNTVVITSDMARKYFGETNPIGETLVFNNKKNYEVVAVLENIPTNSHFNFKFLTSHYSITGFDSLETKQEWNNPNYTTYLLLKPGVDVAALSSKIDAWINPPAEAGQPVSNNSVHLVLEPLSKVHFNTQVSNFGNFLIVTDSRYINIFLIIGLLVLLIACANYINLSTAKASNRAKEVGVRKVIGASFNRLFAQFMTESFLLILPAILISILAIYLILPYLNTLLDKNLPFYIFDPGFLLAIGLGWILVSFLAGIYPALVLTKFKPVETLKGNVIKTENSGLMVRNGLVIFQFSISTILIVGTIIIGSQLKFMQSKKLGLDKDQVLLIRGNTDIYDKLGLFSDELRRISGVEDVAQAWRSPFETVIGNGFSLNPNPTSNDEWHLVGAIAGDQHYLSTLNIKLLAGRDLDPAKIKGDSTVNEFIVNEAFLRHYNLNKEEVIGKQVLLGTVSSRGPGTIVGVMQDFHTSSLHTAIAPVVLFNDPDYFGSILLRAGAGKLTDVLGSVEKVWKSTVPMRPFNYSFLDDEYDGMYRAEQRLGKLMTIFCGMAILIACLGLFGLAAFMVTQRNKEIGIRRVLGASTFGLFALLSKDFMKLILISLLVASPISWYFMNKWLQDFVYRISIEWWVFAGTAMMALLVALTTISFQAIKGATINPVKTLRNN